MGRFEDSPFFVRAKQHVESKRKEAESQRNSVQPEYRGEYDRFKSVLPFKHEYIMQMNPHWAESARPRPLPSIDDYMKKMGTSIATENKANVKPRRRGGVFRDEATKANLSGGGI